MNEVHAPGMGIHSDPLSPRNGNNDGNTPGRQTLDPGIQTSKSTVPGRWRFGLGARSWTPGAWGEPF